MPGKVKVKIISGKNLPVMDRSGDTTDAYVEIKLGTTTYKTDVCRRTLNPQWNTDWYRFEVDDSELQDEPLQIRLMDHDTYSANDAIGKVYLNLNPLLLPAGQLAKHGFNNEGSSNQEISGWIPVYDTMHGIRGEVNITVKVELFSDFNRFRQSSCGVQFFYSPTVPQGSYIRIIHGFVEELIVTDDPEYQWIDKIRTPRASNEARQTTFFKLSGELQRKVGVKALNLGGNAVIGYKQSFDLEGESGIVARGIGTAVTLAKQFNVHASSEPTSKDEHNISSPTEQNGGTVQEQPPTEQIGKQAASPSKSAAFLRRSSDSDLSITPKGNSLTGSDRSTGNPPGHFMKNNLMRTQINQENFDMLEYPFLTTTTFPPNFIVQMGGAVSARSVKLLERITNVEEPESRDMWWSEIRTEIRAHARSLNCNAVLGYSESTSIGEYVCVLSACGTAAVIEFSNFDENDDHLQLLANKLNYPNISSSLDKPIKKEIKTNTNEKSTTKLAYDSPDHIPFINDSCMMTHLPYDRKKVPVKAKISKCLSCGKGKVPEVLIATIEPPDNIPNISRGCFIESYVCRPLKDIREEYVAKEISDGLPFLEYELHRLLLNKLKIKGMNAIFTLKIRIAIGDRMMVGIATGTAVYLSSLPQPVPPTLVSDRTDDEKKLSDLQEALNETIRRNRELYQIKDDNQNGKCLSDDDSDEEPTSLDVPLANKDCCVLEVDDAYDAEVLDLLMEERIPDGFHVVNTEVVPGLEDLEIVKNLQMFTQIYRVKFHPPVNLHKHFLRLLQSVYFKLRRMVPCALCDLQLRVDVPEPDELQLSVIGMALGLGKKQRKLKQNIISKRNDDDLIFKLDEDQMMENVQINKFGQSSFKYKPQKSPQKYPRTQSLKHRPTPQKERHGVDITPLSYVPGGKIEQYLGNLNFFFIRETTSIREEGGGSGFIHSFLTEVLAIVRAHVTALGGNALVAFFLTECILNHNLHKNQGQCLINVGGDVVSVTYFKEENC